MPSVADAQRRQTKTNSSLGIISPLSMGFPLDVETTERQQHRKDQDAEKKRISPDDVTSYRPAANGIHSHIIWQHATMKGYLTKHIPPVFSFTRNRKRRYVILADRFLYTFKTDTPTNKYREVIELGPDTQAFVTDRMANTLYCIEIRKPGADDSTTWFLQAENAEGMKLWLERLKKTIQYMVDYKDDNGPITNDKLHSVHSAEQLFFLHGGMDHPHSCNNDMENNSSSNSNHHDINIMYGTSSGNSSSSNVINTTPRSSEYEIDSRWRHSDSTNWTDTTTSPPMSPSAMTMTGSLSSSSVSTHSPFGYHQQLYFGGGGGIMHRNDSMRSSMSNDDSMPSSPSSANRLNSIRSLHSTGLPDILPPQLPPPSSKLPPPPPSHI